MASLDVNDQMKKALAYLNERGDREALETTKQLARDYNKTLMAGGSATILFPGARVMPSLGFSAENCKMSVLNCVIGHGTTSSKTQTDARLGYAVSVELEVLQQVDFCMVRLVVPNLSAEITAGKVLRLSQGWLYGLIESIEFQYPRGGNKKWPVAGGHGLYQFLYAIFKKHRANTEMLLLCGGQPLTFVGGSTSHEYSIEERSAYMILPYVPVYNDPETRQSLNIAGMTGNNITANFKLNPYARFAKGNALDSKSYIQNNLLEALDVSYISRIYGARDGGILDASPAQALLNNWATVTSYAGSVETAAGKLYQIYPNHSNVVLASPLIQSNSVSGFPVSYTASVNFTNAGEISEMYVYLVDTVNDPNYSDSADFMGNTLATIPTLSMDVSMVKDPVHSSTDTDKENYEQSQRYFTEIIEDNNPAESGSNGPLGSEYSTALVRRKVTCIQFSTLPVVGTADMLGTQCFDGKNVDFKFTLSSAVAAEIISGATLYVVCMAHAYAATDGKTEIDVNMYRRQAAVVNT